MAIALTFKWHSACSPGCSAAASQISMISAWPYGNKTADATTHRTLQAVAAILVTPFRPSGWLSRPTAFSVLDRLASQPAVWEMFS